MTFLLPICTHEHISIQIIHSHEIITKFSHFLKCYVHLLHIFNAEILVAVLCSLDRLHMSVFHQLQLREHVALDSSS